MNILFITIGTLGDVLPLIRLGQGLIEEHHQVRFATYEAYQETVEDAGLEFECLPGNPKKVIEADGARKVYKAKGNPVKYYKGLKKQASEVKAKANAFFDECINLSKNTDLIIYTLTTMVGKSIAEHYKIPSVCALLHPITPTNSFPTFIVPKASIGIANKLSHYLMEQVMWQPYRGIVNQWRQSLDLNPIPFRGPFVDGRKHKDLLLYGYSEHIIPKPQDWHENIHVTGYWLPQQKNWQPSEQLSDFLTQGEKPVYIGFGSIVDNSSEATIQLMLDALALTGKRGIILNSNATHPIEQLNEQVLQIKYAPHAYLFQHVRTAVHHGGAGTCAAALHAGIPSVIVPFMADGIFWGQQLHTRGLAPKPLSRNKVTAESLADAINTACEDSSIRSKAKDTRDRLDTEEGVHKAIGIINSFLSVAR